MEVKVFLFIINFIKNIGIGGMFNKFIIKITIIILNLLSISENWSKKFTSNSYNFFRCFGKIAFLDR